MSSLTSIIDVVWLRFEFTHNGMNYKLGVQLGGQNASLVENGSSIEVEISMPDPHGPESFPALLVEKGYGPNRYRQADICESICACTFRAYD